MRPPRKRARTSVDFRRVGLGLKMPGIDPRAWLALARVDDDDDAVVWDAELGWLVDVTFVGGSLDGDGPNLCRQRRGLYEPPHRNGLVLVAVVGGDANMECVILAELDVEDRPAPTTVNGDTIDEAFATRTHIGAFPNEDLDLEFENVRVTGQMKLGAPDADQPYIRGNDYADAEADFLDALDQFLTSAPPPGPFGSVNSATFIAAATQLKLALQQFKLAKSTYLSQVIRGT